MASQTYQSPTTNPSPCVKGQKKAPNVVHQKVVHHYANGTNPSACFVRVFKLRIQLPLHPVILDKSFYLQPLEKWPHHAGSDELQWDMGHLTQTIARLLNRLKFVDIAQTTYSEPLLL